MEVDTRVGKTKGLVIESPKDRRLPLRVLVFREPTSVEGTTTMLAHLEAYAEQRLAGNVWQCPALFIDYQSRVVFVGKREYPLERVHYWERATTAFPPKKLKEPDFREGKH